MKHRIIFFMCFLCGFLIGGAIFGAELIEYPLQPQNELKTEIEALENKIIKPFTDAEIEMLAKCVEAEATNQGLMGKMLVVDVILNRVDSEKFPNTIADVITAPKQFAVYSNGRMERVTPTDETYKAIKLEIMERTDSQILYFNAGGFSSWYVPAYQYGDHYFGY